jgi:hypothetical protein
MTTLKLSGGDKLEKYLMELAVKVQKPATLNVGFLEGATYPNGTSVAEIAAYNEYGVPSHNQPPRPFFRGMISSKSGNWGKSVGALLKSNEYDAEKSLELMGEGISGQLRESITEFTTPELAESTKQAKGFDKPLIDTGHMLDSVDYEVKS